MRNWVPDLAMAAPVPAVLLAFEQLGRFGLVRDQIHFGQLLLAIINIPPIGFCVRPCRAG